MKPVRHAISMVVFVGVMGIGLRAYCKSDDTKTVSQVVEESEQQQEAEGEILILISKYRAAMESRSVDNLAAVVDPEGRLLLGDMRLQLLG